MSTVSSTDAAAQTPLPQEKEALEVARTAAALPLLAKSHTGSTIVLASLRSRDLALILDEDARALRIVDAESLEERGRHPLEGRPSQVVVAGDGRAYVALRELNRIDVLEASAGDGVTLKGVASIPVAPEPVALATDPAGTTLVVTSAWGARFATYDVKTHAEKRSVPLAREPRGVTVSSDGETAHVAHVVGSRITRVSMKEGETTELTVAGSDFTPRPRPRFICRIPFHDNITDSQFRSGMGNHIIHDRDAVQGFAIAILDDRVFVPEVLVHRGEVVVGGYGTSESYPSHQPALAVIEGDETWLRVPNQAVRADKSRYNFAGGSRTDACFLPRAAAADPVSKSVLVGCHGTNEVLLLSADTSSSLTRGTKARWKVPSGPTGIAVDTQRKRALVWSQYARKLTALPLPEPQPEEEAHDKKKTPPSLPRLPKQQVAQLVVTLPPATTAQPALSAAALRGRELFHGAGDRRISADGRACASCHPDGREDGLTWPTPFGPRQTPMLAGRLGDTTVPFGWHGDADTPQTHVTQTFRRLGGTGLTGDDLDALIAYCQEMSTPPTLPAGDPALVAHGKELFFADTVGCATCHKDGGGSDGNRHEVGSGPKLDTPSLLFIAGTAPYFHDGRYQTLGELLEHTQGKMGWGAEMTSHDRQALEAYLLTL